MKGSKTFIYAKKEIYFEHSHIGLSRNLPQSGLTQSNFKTESILYMVKRSLTTLIAINSKKVL